MKRENSTININEEQNMQQKKRRYLQSYPASCTYSDLKKWEIIDRNHLLRKEFALQIHMIMAFKNGSALILSKDRMVYGLGTNFNCQLELDKHMDYIPPGKVKALCGKNIKTFYCSNNERCVFALTEEGEVYSWYSNENIQGFQESFKICTFAKMDSLSEKRIIDIAANDYNSLALTDSGEIYIWGDVEFSSKYVRSIPYQVKFSYQLKEKKIVNIVCGGSFIMALSDDGKLYGWGKNDYGQLGINSGHDEMLLPFLVASLTDVTIVKIVCGSNHSLALTSEGKIYSWGSNDKGQLGYGKISKLERKPIMLNIPTMGKVSDIAAQNDKSVAINNIGCSYIWGRHLERDIYMPIRIECSNMCDVFRYKIPYIIHDSTKEKSNMLEYLGAAFNDLSTSDLTIKIEEQLIHVHKAILKIRCQYFRSMFRGWTENNQSIIEHKQFSYNVYKTFLKYLYTDVIDHLPLEESFELLMLCDEYNETELERKCIRMISENVTVSNVALYYVKAIEYNAKDLEEFCFQFALCHMTEVVQSETFAELNKNMILFDFMIKAAKAGAYKT